jgi:hypothetical protein
MKQLATILFLAMLVMAPAAVSANQYGWTVSGSPVDPFVNSGTPTGGIMNLYLWLQCALDGGAAAAEFAVAGPVGSVLAFTPMNGFLNAGGATNLLLATACNAGPVVAGNWLCLSLPGTFCLVPSANNKNVTVDCVGFVEHTNRTVGFGNGVTATCFEFLCIVDYAEPASWGKVKALFHR